MILQFKSPLCGLALAASTHGLSDAANPIRLWRYAVIPLPLGSFVSTTLFFTGSFFHFGQDIVNKYSLILHGSLGIISLLNYELACTFMCMYYLILHVPLHIQKILRKSLKWGMFIIFSAIVLLPFTAHINQFQISEIIQRSVFAHAITDHKK